MLMMKPTTTLCLSIALVVIISFASAHAHDHDRSHTHEHAHGHEHHHHSNRNGDQTGHKHHDNDHVTHDHDHHGEHAAKVDDSTLNGRDKSSRWPESWLWAYALGSTALIGCAPVLVLLLLPVTGAPESQQDRDTLNVLLGFAVGGLLGDCFLHLLPHSTGADHNHEHHHHHAHGHDHSHELRVGLWLLGGILTFLCIEKVMRYRSSGMVHAHSHGIRNNIKDTSTAKFDDNAKPLSNVPAKMHVAAYLNLAADAFHNFTDGMAIGASFLGGVNLGFVTVIAILMHELPHEISDFAILVRSGVSPRKAMLLQLLTALGAILGTVVGLLVEGAAQSAGTSWILPFTAGGFLYIAMTTVLPELLDERSSPMQSCKEVLAIIFGIFLMYLVGMLE